MPWDSVEVGLAGGEETVNFGPRNESGSPLYQVDTLASVSPRGEELQSCPHFHGTSCPEGFALVATSQVILFNASCSDVEATLNFDSEIDSVVWSADSLFLAIGERSGTFHFLHTASRQILFSQEVGAAGIRNNRDDSMFLSMAFTSPNHGEPCNLVILTSSGILTEFSNLYLQRLNKAIIGGEFELVEELRALSQVQSVNVGVVHQEAIRGVTIGFLWDTPVLITYGEGDAAIAVWTNQPNNGHDEISLLDSISSYILGGSGVIKASASSHGHFLIVLDDKNMLSLWNIESLTMIAFWSHLAVVDFLLLSSSSVQTPGTSRSGDEFKLVVLTTPNEKTQYLQIYCFPSMKQTYSLQINSCSLLAKCPSTQESIYFVESVTPDVISRPSEMQISCLRIRCLTEALPENRLSRLLHKQKFDDAEKFARQFKLDVELVFKVKVNWLLDKVLPWSYQNSQTGEIAGEIENFSLNNLMECLTKIKDDDYVCRCCLQAVLPSLEETFDLLSYVRRRTDVQNLEARKISTGNTSQDKKEHLPGTPSHLLTEVLEALDKLATYEMAFGVQKFRGTEWQHFLSADLLAEMNKCLLSDKVMSAVIIWRRHKGQFQAQFSLEKLESLLGSIGQSLPSSTIVPWLQDDLVPFVSRVLPQGLKMLAHWLEQRARNMELSEKDGWPHNALQLASVLLSAPNNVLGSASGRGLATPFQFVDQVCGLPAAARTLLSDGRNNLNVEDELARLMTLVQQLTDLVDLHTKYCCRITLAEFAQETTNTIVFRLLDRVVAAELIASSIAKYIAPYMMHHRLDRDTMLLEYIEDLFNRGAGLYSSLSNSLWEARVIAVISCIKNKEVRCKATLEVMRHAMIPWSDSVEKLVAEFMAAYPDDMDLKEQYRLVELKKMLSQYGMRTFQVSYASRAKAITRYILTRDDPAVMEDALKVVTAYSHITEDEAYVFRLEKLCLQNKIPDCLELLGSVSLPEAEQYGHELVTWLCGILDEEQCSELDDTSGKIIAAQAGVEILKFLKKYDLTSLIDVDDLLVTLQMISALQREFSLFLSVEEYLMPEVRKNIFLRYLGKYLGYKDSKVQGRAGEKEEPENNGKELQWGAARVNLTKLFRLSELVGIPKNNVRMEVALKTIGSGDVTSALEMCRELVGTAPCERTAYTVYEVALNLCEQLAEGNSLVADSNKNIYDVTHMIYELLCEASTQCSPDLLCDCAELCKFYRLTDCIYSQCESGDYGFSVQSTPQSSNQDPFAEWTFGQRFREDGLVLDSFVALPLAAKSTVACFPVAGGPHVQGSYYYQARVAGRRRPGQESKADESGETSDQPSYLMRISSAGLNVIRCLQENSLCELALRYLVETLGLCLQHFAANDMLLAEKDGETNNSMEKQRLAKISLMGTKMVNELNGSLLRKVFNCKAVDHDLGLGYLCSISKQTVFQYLVSGTNFLGQSCAKILAFAKVGIDYAQLCKEPALLTKCQEIATNASWAIRLGNLKMSLKDVYKTDTEEKSSLLPELMQKPYIDLEMILEFCRAFGLDEDNALLEYVKLQLLPPTTISGVDTLLSRIDTHEMPYERNIRMVFHRITCSSSLLKLLVDVGSKVDPYDYDRIVVILKLIKELSYGECTATVEKGIQLLDYLYQYERKAPPSSYERSFFLSSMNSKEEKIRLENDRPLSPLSKVRLPYHPLLYGDPWKVLAPELSEETVPKLLGIAKLLKLSSDQMYLTAIRNLANTSSDSNTPTDIHDATVSSTGIEEGLANTFSCEKAKRMLFCVRKTEMAIAAARWIAQKLPLGEEKIDVLQTCVDLAMNWKTSCCPEEEEKANMTHSRLSELCRTVATEHVLHKYNIKTPSLVSSKPAKLICQLYENYGARDPAKIHQPPDIHKASEEIANVNNSKINKIRIYLIEKWLPSRQSSGENGEFSAGEGTEESEEDEQNLKRVIYLMQSSDQENAIRFLLNLASKDGSFSSHLTSNCRVRALRALFAIAPGETIERLSNTSIKIIRQQMQALVCLAELEGLHIQQSVSSFDKCNKEGLVRGLWRNHKHEKKAVRLVADLCLDNNIHDPQLWNSVVQQLLAFGMIKYLRRVLVNLAGISELWQVRCLPQVWRSVLMAPFKHVSVPLSVEEAAACEESASLLQRCPLLLDLDVYSIAVQFHKVGLQAHALACLLLIPSSSTRQQHIQALLETNYATLVLSQLDEQRERGRTLTQADIVEQEVFKYIEEKQEYQVLLETAYFDRFLRYLVLNKNIAGILLKTIQSNRLENAMQLVRLFHRAHPDLASSQYAASNHLTEFDELWAFLEMNGLLEASLPFLPHLEGDNDNEEPTTQQQQEEGEVTIDRTEIQEEPFSLMMTADYSVEFPL